MVSMPDQDFPLVCLPEPYKTRYELKASDSTSPRSLRLVLAQQQTEGLAPSEPLHHESLTFSEPTLTEQCKTLSSSDNTPFAIAQRAPTVMFSWQSAEPPTVGQAWILVYAIVTLRSDPEIFTVQLSGKGREALIEELQAVGLARLHPGPSPFFRRPGHPTPEAFHHADYPLVVSQAAFWQGAGSPLGPRPAWVAGAGGHSRISTDSYAPRPLEYTLTTKFSEPQVHTHHPVRPLKPRPGSLIYSRYIPHLDEFFSMVALDYRNAEHLQLFHQWQNDPRVARGWNETGTLDEHREYLRRIDVDPHQIAVLAKFNDSFFAYFEIYWAKVRTKRPPRIYPKVTDMHRKTTWALTTMRETMIVDGTLLWATQDSEAHTESWHGGRVWYTSSSWMTRGHRMWSGSQSM